MVGRLVQVDQRTHLPVLLLQSRDHSSQILRLQLELSGLLCTLLQIVARPDLLMLDLGQRILERAQLTAVQLPLSLVGPQFGHLFLEFHLLPLQ